MSRWRKIDGHLYLWQCSNCFNRILSDKPYPTVQRCPRCEADNSRKMDIETAIEILKHKKPCVLSEWLEASEIAVAIMEGVLNNDKS